MNHLVRFPLPTVSFLPQLLNGEGLGGSMQITNAKAWGAEEHVGGTRSKITSTTLGWGTMENVGKGLMVDRLSV